MATLNSWDRDHTAYRVYREDEKEKEEEVEGEEEMKRGREEGKGDVCFRHAVSPFPMALLL